MVIFLFVLEFLKRKDKIKYPSTKRREEKQIWSDYSFTSKQPPWSFIPSETMQISNLKKAFIHKKPSLRIHFWVNPSFTIWTFWNHSPQNPILSSKLGQLFRWELKNMLDDSQSQNLCKNPPAVRTIHGRGQSFR